MKKLFFTMILLFGALALPGAEPQIVCDEESGICRIVDSDEETQAAAAAPEKTLHLERKLVGMTGKDEFMAFLKGEKAQNSVNAAFWGMMLLALLGGLALNLTPCVLPMLPVNLAIIGASGGNRGFRRGLLYGLAMAATYGVLGLLAAFAGLSFGTLNSSPLFNFAIALIFLVLSLAMAGVFNFDPASKFNINPRNLNLSGDMTALVMGAVSALLAGACVAPVVISVLVFAAGNPAYGWLAPLMLGIGMALPWPLAGAGLSVLPKPGKFMVRLKYFFALIIFLAGVYYIRTGIKLLPSGGGLPVMESGIVSLEKGMEKAAETGKPLLVKFTASWCKNCHAMDRNVLADPEVKEYISRNFILVTFPAEDPSEPAVAGVLKKYDIPGFPAFVILK